MYTFIYEYILIVRYSIFCEDYETENVENVEQRWTRVEICPISKMSTIQQYVNKQNDFVFLLLGAN